MDEAETKFDTNAALTSLRVDLGDHAPNLDARAESEIEDRGFGHHILHYRMDDRAAVIEAAADGHIHAAFLWNDRPLFADQFTAAPPLARLLSRWVGERVMPSAMRAEFPSLEIDKLADFFERGVPLEGEFVRSWDAIESFYQEDHGEHFAPARAFIRELREAGYDRRLRAGQSMSIMGLSRSRDQGLRDEQPRIWFGFNGITMDVDANIPPGDLPGHPVRLTDHVREMLEQLAAQPLA